MIGDEMEVPALADDSREGHVARGSGARKQEGRECKRRRMQGQCMPAYDQLARTLSDCLGDSESRFHFVSHVHPLHPDKSACEGEQHRESERERRGGTHKVGRTINARSQWSIVLQIRGDCRLPRHPVREIPSRMSSSSCTLPPTFF